MSIPVDASWFAIDVKALASNFKNAKRMTNHVAALYSLQRGVNFVSAKCPRVVACFSVPTLAGNMTTASSEPSQGADQYPTWAWLVPDAVTNARSRSFFVNHLFRETDPSPTSDAFAQRSTNSGGGHGVDGTTKGGTYNFAIGHAPASTEGGYDYAQFSRGGVAGETEDGLATFEAYRPYGLVCQDDPLSALDSVSHKYVSIGQRPGDPALGDYTMQQISDEFDDVRQKNLPILMNWFAHCVTGDFVSPAGTLGSIVATKEAITVRDATSTNVLDQSSTSWGAATPGWQTHVQYHGIGNPSKGSENRVRVTCRVLARAHATHAGTVSFEGPLNSTGTADDGVAASTDITVTAGGGLAWYGSDSNYFHLDALQANDITTTARNKIDVLASIANTAGAVQIYALQAWMVYGI